MKQEIAYRVHATKLEIGDYIPESQCFFNLLDEEKKLIEESFESKRPKEKPRRFNARYLFKNEIDALDFITPKDNHYLYKVMVYSENIIHIGDWNWLQKASENFTDVEIYAENYWTEKTTNKPKMELIVKEAQVVEEVELDLKTRTDLKSKKYNLPDFNEMRDWMDKDDKSPY